MINTSDYTIEWLLELEQQKLATETDVIDLDGGVSKVSRAHGRALLNVRMWIMKTQNALGLPSRQAGRYITIYHNTIYITTLFTILMFIE